MQTGFANRDARLQAAIQWIREQKLQLRLGRALPVNLERARDLVASRSALHRPSSEKPRCFLTLRLSSCLPAFFLCYKTVLRQSSVSRLVSFACLLVVQ